jgi:hypothetical protein
MEILWLGGNAEDVAVAKVGQFTFQIIISSKKLLAKA